MRCLPPLCLGRINTPASVVGVGQMERAGSAARVERYVELSVLAVFADNCSRTIRLQRLQIDSERTVRRSARTRISERVPLYVDLPVCLPGPFRPGKPTAGA